MEEVRVLLALMGYRESEYGSRLSEDTRLIELKDYNRVYVCYDGRGGYVLENCKNEVSYYAKEEERLDAIKIALLE